MKKAKKITLWILLILIVVVAIVRFAFLKPEHPQISPEDRAQIKLMPLPSELLLGNKVFVLDENITHEFSRLITPRLQQAVDRFYTTLDSQTGLSFGNGNDTRLILKCTGMEMKYPSPEDDESYSINISSKEIEVKSNSETGIIYGLESLLQLVKRNEGEWILSEMKLKDNPRYPWRGLLIDVCRHWIPKDVILRNLDAMAAVKINVLHWHLTEDQGFRVESKMFPELHEMGSNGLYYTQDDIKEVIEYAADRGIRVVPEFDLPGHSTSWFVGYPALASAPGPYEIDTVFGIRDPVMDPTREEVYEFLDQFFGEMATLFPDEYIHIGGDEVRPDHWNKNPSIQRFMKKNGLEDHHALQAYFNIRLQEILAKYDKKMMGWDEIIHPDLPKNDIVVQSWRDQKALWTSARNGNKAVLSAGYYLSHKQSASFHYNIDPIVNPGIAEVEPLTPEQEANILGGEACMWSEMVDARTIESRIWPRTAVVAEKLWSLKELTNDHQDMYRRLIVMDDLLERIGLKHRENSEALIHDMAGEPYLDPLRILVSVLQEDKKWKRLLIYQPKLYTTTPLNRIVDAARPESYVVYKFSKDVDLWIESSDEAARSRIKQTLGAWSVNHEKLAPAFKEVERLKEIEPHSINLSRLAKLGLEVLNDHDSLKSRRSEILILFETANQASGGTILPLVDPVRKLMNSVD